MRHFAFLRAINVGGRTVRMEQLRQLLTAGGFDDVETFIASGNVIFRADGRSVSAQERRIAAQLEAGLGFVVDTFVRRSSELRACLERAGTLREREADLQYVGFLHGEPASAARARLTALNDDGNRFDVTGREVHWLRRGGMPSPYSGAIIEKALGESTTLRNVNTVERVVERYIP